MVLTIATGNAEKAALLATCIDARIELVDLREPQADAIEDVARAKAQEALARFGGGVIVEDSGLIVPSLGGFPGPSTKYVLATIGAAGLARLARGAPCIYRSCVGVADARGIEVHTHEIAGTIADAEGGALWDAFAVDGVAFAALPAPVQARHVRALRDAIAARLREWAR